MNSTEAHYLMKTYLEKIKSRRKIVADVLRKDLKDEAHRLVRLLEAEEFKFKRVYLFGSITKDKLLSSWSDIDLAIEGLDEEVFYKVYACLLKNSDFAVDLKPFEDLDVSFQKKIRNEGWIIYEKE